MMFRLPTSGNPLRYLAFPILVVCFGAAGTAQTTKPAPDPNAIDTGNFNTSQGTPDTQQSLAHQIAQLPWVDGPAAIAIGPATINVPAGYEILNPPNGEKFLQLNGNPPSTDDAGDNILQSDDPASNWFAIVTYETTGHISDAVPIDPGALLTTMQNLNNQDNAARQKRGQPTENLNGWAIPPSYDKSTHRLSWAFDFTDPGNTPNITLNIRLLGRAGDLKTIIVDDPAALIKDIPDIDKAMADIGFDPGQTYADATASDAQSPYALAAIIGGATPNPQPPQPKSDNRLIGALAVVAAVIGVAFGKIFWRKKA